MARFKLIRRREDDGAVDHVLEFFLVGPDGRSLMQYVGEKAAPDQVAADVLRVAVGEKATMNDGSSVAVTY